jgi:hypothetical protein
MFSATLAIISTISPSLKPPARACARSCVGEFTTLDDDAAGELEDGIGSGIGRARPNRVVDFNSTQPDFGGHSRVPAQAVSAKVALGDGERELLRSFFVEGSAGERRAQTHESFKHRRRIRKNAKQVRDQREFRADLCEESPDRTGCMIGINWLDAILVSGFAHRYLRLLIVRDTKHSFRAKPLPKSMSVRRFPGLLAKRRLRSIVELRFLANAPP